MPGLGEETGRRAVPACYPPTAVSPVAQQEAPPVATIKSPTAT
jgi:hypothetical protein